MLKYNVSEDLQIILEGVDKVLRDLVVDTISELTPLRLSIWEKSPQDFVTSADKELDDLLTTELERTAVPVASEERPDSWRNVGEKLCWVVDPLDGTSNFIAGLPFFGFSVALVSEGIPVYGVVCDLLRRDFYSSLTPSEWILPASQHRPQFIGCSTGALSSASSLNPQVLRALNRGFKLRVLGSQALQLAYTASGRLEATLSEEARGWDDAAGIALLRCSDKYYASAYGMMLSEENISEPRKSIAAVTASFLATERS